MCAGHGGKREGTRPRALTGMGGLASTYRNQGQWKGAEELEAGHGDVQEGARLRAPKHLDQHGQPRINTPEPEAMILDFRI